jgi:chorismate synthase
MKRSIIAMLALVLGEAMMEKFGGDNIAEIKRNLSAYIKSGQKTRGS